MEIIKVYKYRLYPDKTQQKQLDYMLWQGRKIYNGALEMWKECFEVNGCDPSSYDLRDYWCEQRKVEPDTYGTLPAVTVDDLIRRLKKSYQNAYRRLERGDFSVRKDGSKNYGFPKFKGRYEFNSLGFLPATKPIAVLSDKWAQVYLTKIGDIKVRYHRELPENSEVKMIVISRDKLDHWYANFQIEYEIDIQENTNPAVGIDVGLVYALALSDGHTLESPKWYQEAQKKRRILQRKVDRQRRANNPQNYSEEGTVKTGVFIWYKSTRMKQTEQQIRKLEAHIAQQRNYWWNDITDWLTKEYGLIAIEDLSLDFMIKNRRLALDVHDVAIGTFYQQLEYKCKERGVELVKVPAAYTSQCCSVCGHIDKENRKTQAEFVCVNCGHSENADINAAKNILNSALEGLYWPCGAELKPTG